MADAPAIPAMSEDDARRITERIRSLVVQTREGMEKVQRLLTEAKDGNAHVALGYGEGEWTRYMADLFADQPLRLPRDQRKELVGYLAGEGMSSAAIAPIINTTDRRARQIMAEARQAGSDFRPAPQSTPAVDRTTGDVSDWPVVPPPGQAPTAQKTTGLDGKQYSRPTAQPPAEPVKPKRRALTDQFFDAAYDMNKAVERVARLTADDRFPRNADQVAAKHRNDLIRARDLLQQVISQLS